VPGGDGPPGPLHLADEGLAPGLVEQNQIEFRIAAPVAARVADLEGHQVAQRAGGEQIGHPMQALAALVGQALGDRDVAPDQVEFRELGQVAAQVGLVQTGLGTQLTDLLGALGDGRQDGLVDPGFAQLLAQQKADLVVGRLEQAGDLGRGLHSGVRSTRFLRG